MRLCVSVPTGNQWQSHFDYRTKVKRPLRGQRPLQNRKSVGLVVAGVGPGRPGPTASHALDDFLGEVALGLKQLGHLA